MMSGGYAGMLAGEEAAATAKTGGDLVGDEEHALFVAQVAHPPQVIRGIETHAPGALDDGLQDDRRQLLTVPPHQVLERRRYRRPAGLAETASRGRGEKLARQEVGEEMMHAGDRVAHRHGVEGIPVVAAAQGQ